MADTEGDLKPHQVYTAAIRVVFVELGLVEILRYVEEKSGKVADNVPRNGFLEEKNILKVRNQKRE